MLTAYCLSYGNWTVIPKQWKESFSDMKNCGFDAVALSFSESEMKYSRRAFEMQVKMAHDCGLKVHVIPSRLGRRIAGAPYMCSMWLMSNPQAQLPEDPSLACVESKDFQEWTKQFITTLVEDYEIDGLIWDEPKAPDFVTKHPEAIAKYGECATPEMVMSEFARLIDELSSIAKKIRPELTVSLFNMPNTNPRFSYMTSGLENIDYAGFDGNFSRQSYFHEKPEKIKHSLSEVWERTLKECAAHGKKTFALIENMLMPADVIEEYAIGLEKFLSYAQPDHLGCYYYAHNNSSPEEVHRITMEIINRCYINTKTQMEAKDEKAESFQGVSS